jgi:hypothetical protein
MIYILMQGGRAMSNEKLYEPDSPTADIRGLRFLYAVRNIGIAVLILILVAIAFLHYAQGMELSLTGHASGQGIHNLTVYGQNISIWLNGSAWRILGASG